LRVVRRSLTSLSLALFLALTSACVAAPEPPGPRIETVDDLLTALGDAGVEVAETALMASMPDLPRGRVVALGEQRVEMYETDSPDDRRLAVEQLLRRLPADSPPNVWASGRAIVVYDGRDGPTIALLSGLMGDDLSLPAPGPDEPFPPAVVSAIGWLADQTGVDPGLVVVEAFEAAEWPDACLGLPAEGEACAGVITPGWRVTLRLGDHAVTLRTDDLGTRIRQEP
jgi:hypothetical protein